MTHPPTRLPISLRWTLALLPLAVVSLSAFAQAQSVSLAGMLGDKALLVIDGGKPQPVGPGETFQGVRVVSTQGNTAVLEIDGTRRSLRVGGAPVNVGQQAMELGAEAKGTRLVLLANAEGRFATQGSINKRTVALTVDFDTPEMVLGRADADRLGLKYREGEPTVMDSPKGASQGWRVKLASVRIQDVEVRDVDAIIAAHAVPQILLGRSFLARFQVTRDSKQVVLEKRPS